jgi:hypothetical protein
MSQYNLIRNAYFDSLTTSGTGNISLTWTQLESLMDGITTSGGVTLTSSGILFLEADLSQRIKVDEIRLYADDLGQAAYINFYYKNATGDSYTLLATQSGSYYYATISDPSAPRYIRATISGVAITLYEFEILNDDYIVAFGDDGTQYAEYLADTPVGEEGTPQAVAIFNNGTGAMPADAYVCIDYTGEVADEYVKISASENGTYYGIYDEALIEDNQIGSEYRWSMGQLSGSAVISADKIITNDTYSTLSYPVTDPLVSTSTSFYAAEHVWEYDSINDVLYMMGSDGILKLWRYNYDALTFTYLTEISPGCTGHALNATMAYLGGKIYCLTNGNQTFGQHTLSGAVNNWTPLTSHPVARNGTYPRRNLCSDYNRYIYCVDYWQDTGTKNFYRYDTVSGTWTSLSNGYYIYNSSTTNTGYCNMAYDVTRDYIYLIIGHRDRDDSRYIQRYQVSTDTWNTTYLYYGSFFAVADNVGKSISYYGDNIFFVTSAVANTVYKYDLTTATWSGISVDFSVTNPSYNNSGVYFIAFKKDGVFRIFAARLVSGNDYVDSYPRSSVVSLVVTASGSFTSPIFELEEANNSSYFLVDGTAVSGAGSISYDPAAYNGTIRVRGSNTEPLMAKEIYVANTTGANTVVVHRWLPDSNTSTTNWMTIGYTSSSDKYVQVMVNNKRLDRTTIISCRGDVYYTKFITISTHDGTLYAYTSDYADRLYYATKASYTNTDSIWAYGYHSSYPSETGYLKHWQLYSGSYNPSSIYSLREGTDFVTDLCAEWDGQGVWYTHKQNNLLIHRDYLGTLLQSILVTTAGPVCSTTDNGCWTVDNGSSVLQARRYNYSGTLVKTVSLTRTASRLVNDWSDGFWYTNGQYVYHVTSEGVQDLTGISMLSNIYALEGSHDGCFVYCREISTVKFIDRISGIVTKSWVVPSNQTYYSIGIRELKLDEWVDYKLDGTHMPVSYDPVWGTASGSLAWQEVRKDGYFLPKAKYQQAEITLRKDASLEKILMPPAVKVQDIASQTYKDVYVKTDIPLDANITDYEARIKTWWGVE